MGQETGKTKILKLGRLGEEFAQQEYIKQGYKIVGVNEFNRKGKRVGEIDFIARNKNKIVFVEVKARTSEVGAFGSGAEAVDYRKQQKLLKAVKIFLLQNPMYQELQPQIDVCVIGLDKSPYSVTIITNAVEDSN